VLSIALAELQKRKLLNRFQCRTISIRSGLMATQKKRLQQPAKPTARKEMITEFIFTKFTSHTQAYVGPLLITTPQFGCAMLSASYRPTKRCRKSLIILASMPSIIFTNSRNPISDDAHGR